MLKLIPLSWEYKRHLTDMMDEWSAAGEQIVPYSICRLDYRNFAEYLIGFQEEQKPAGLPDFVPATTLFCLDTDRDLFVGAVNIRHRLNEQLLQSGGHIGDGIRPSERRKGYATNMIALALEKCRSMDIDRVLMVCAKNNIASAKSILKNNGVLENEIELDGVVEQRYWIEL